MWHDRCGMTDVAFPMWRNLRQILQHGDLDTDTGTQLHVQAALNLHAQKRAYICECAVYLINYDP